MRGSSFGRGGTHLITVVFFLVDGGIEDLNTLNGVSLAGRLNTVLVAL